MSEVGFLAVVIVVVPVVALAMLAIVALDKLSHFAAFYDAAKGIFRLVFQKRPQRRRRPRRKTVNRKDDES